MAKLWVVATPIGNLQDLTPRMREAFECCDLIAAEDTRVTMKLLNHLGIKKPLLSCNATTSGSGRDEIVSRCSRKPHRLPDQRRGHARVSDPGYALVAAARAAGIEISPIAGPSAITAALSVSGLRRGPFAFLGFLRASARRGVRFTGL